MNQSKCEFCGKKITLEKCVEEMGTGRLFCSLSCLMASPNVQINNKKIKGGK